MLYVEITQKYPKKELIFNPSFLDLLKSCHEDEISECIE